MGDDSEKVHVNLDVACAWCNKKRLKYSYTIKHTETGTTVELVGGCCAIKMGGDSTFIAMHSKARYWAKLAQQDNPKVSTIRDKRSVKVTFARESDLYTCRVTRTNAALLQQFQSASPSVLGLAVERYIFGLPDTVRRPRKARPPETPHF